MINYKSIINIFLAIYLFGIGTVFIKYGLFSAASFSLGYLIILLNFTLLIKSVTKSMEEKTGSSFFSTLFRWTIFGVLLVVSLFMVRADRSYFLIGIIAPFLGIIIIGFYQILWRKEDGPKSSS